MNTEQVLARLHSLGNPANVAGMARFGINPEHALGISMVTLRSLAKEIGKNHSLSLQLWNSAIHEARILACLVADPSQVTEAQIDTWVNDINSWDLCDQFCSDGLFKSKDLAYSRVTAWTSREETFVKRAGFVLMAHISLKDKKAPDERLEPFFAIIEREAWDNRNYVTKAVNWALRQLGKRSLTLNKSAILAAERIRQQGTKSARWIASDALGELQSEKVQLRLAAKHGKLKSNSSTISKG